MATITEDYVSFETAKLLKDKGFNEFTFSNYNENGIVQFTEVETRVAKGYQRPTLQMAMKWLRKIHGIDITIKITNLVCKKRKYYCMIYDRDNNSYILDLFNSYEEACDAAIKQCLENLI